MENKLSIAYYTGRLHTTCFFDWTQNFRFERVINDKRQKVSKTLKNQNFDFSDGQKVCVKTYGSNQQIKRTSHNLIWQLKIKSQIWVGYFWEKSKSLKKNGRKIKNLTLPRVITVYAKKLGVAAYAGELLQLNFPIEIKTSDLVGLFPRNFPQPVLSIEL